MELNNDETMVEEEAMEEEEGKMGEYEYIVCRSIRIRDNSCLRKKGNKLLAGFHANRQQQNMWFFSKTHICYFSFMGIYRDINIWYLS